MSARVRRPARAVGRAGALALLMLALWRGLLLAHATLLSSEPKSNDTLAESPARIRLVFSEELEPTLGRISLEGADGHAAVLAAKGDPHDVHALIAEVGPLAAGPYRVIWRVVSADGHPVGGSYVFHVAPGAGSPAAHAPPPPPPDVSTAADGAPAPNAGPSLGAAPLVPSLLRGLGLGALMVLGGLLFFLVGERRDGAEDGSSDRASRAARWLSVAAPLLLGAHFLAWVAHTSPTGSLDGAWLRATAGTTAGRVELTRVALAVLVCWAMLLARRAGVALAFAAVALTVSGGVGHPAAMHPEWAVPAKAVHLLAGALWAGGIAWLLSADRGEGAAATFAARTERVSGVALAAAVAVAFTGVVQTRLFLAEWSDLVRSTYGVIVLAKVAGLLVLVGFGAYYRKRVIARLRDSAVVRATFGRLLRGELAVIAVVILLGGLLAYLAPPMEDMASASSGAAAAITTSLHDRP